MKATAKTLRLVAAIALAFAATTAAAAGKPVVKVTESYGDGIHYWVKYTINGMEYRSDIAGKEINKKAWLYMSDEDRLKTVRTVTYIWDARQEQFGELAYDMGKWYDEKMGYTEAAKIKQEELVKKYHSDLWSRFSDEKIAAYISGSVTPAGIEGDLSEYPELYFKYEGLKVLFECARDAYSRLGPAEWRRTEAAVKSVSGDLIQLICDKVLVPNITPSGMLSGIDAIGSKIFGAVLDMANTLSGAQDKLVENVVGERTTADKARLVIDNANNAITSLRKIVVTCMNGVQSLRAEIESKYPALKEAHDKRKNEVQDAYAAKLKEAKDARDVSDVSGEVASQLVELRAMDDRIAALASQHAAAVESGDKSRAKALHEEYERAVEQRNRKHNEFYDRLVARCKNWGVTYFGTTGYGGLFGDRVEELRAMLDEQMRMYLDSPLASSIVLGSFTAPFSSLKSDEVVNAIAAARKYISYMKAQPEKFQAFYAGTFALAKEANRELGQLRADESALTTPTTPAGRGTETDLSDYVRILDWVLNGQGVTEGRYSEDVHQQMRWYLSNCTGPEDMYSADEIPTYKIMETRLEQFDKAYSDWEMLETAHRNLEEKMRPVWDKAIAELEKANQDFGTFDATLPVYITEQNLGGNSLVILDENSTLGKKFLPPDGTADAAEANSYRQQLDSLMEQRNKLYVDLNVARQNVEILEQAYPSFAEAGSSKKQKLKMNKVAANSTSGENVAKLVALWKDFNNRNEAHDNEVEYMLDLYENEDSYKTQILGEYSKVGEGWQGIAQKELSDPFLVLAMKARGFGQHSGKWYNPNSWYMPGYDMGLYGEDYAIIRAASSSYRGLASYAYFAKDYYKTYFANEPDPFDDFVEPKLNEIDAARAAAAGTKMFTVTFMPNGGGGGEMPPQMFVSGAPQTLNANIWEPPFPGETFLGWALTWDGDVIYTDRALVTIGENRTLYAIWSGSSGGGSGGMVPGPTPTPEPEEVHELHEEIDGAAPVTVASEYNGYLYDEKNGAVKGTIQVKVGKPGKDGAASVKATVVIGTKKVTLKGKDKGKATIEKNGPTEIELVGGEACVIVFGAEGLAGYYGAYLIDGSRNFFASKDKGEVEEANTILSKWLGSFMVIWDGGSLSVSIAAKGKVKVSGTLANGKTKISVSTVLLVGEEWCCVSVAAQKANLAFVLWLSHDGRTIEAEGLGDNVLVGKAGALANGAAFHVDADEFASVFGQTMLPYLPDGVPVTQKGTKWSLPKAGKVVYKNGAVDESKLGENPCGLKLTYKAKEGTFKGSFKVYTEVKGKPKATTVNVTGFLLNGIGYGTATIKGKGSVPVTIE